MLFATAELARSKRQFATLMLGAGLLVFVLLFVQGLLTAVLDGLAGALARQSGPVVVYTKDAQRAVAGSFMTAEMVETVRGAEGVGDAGELGVSLLTFTSATAERPFGANVIGYRTDRPGVPTAVRTGNLPQAPGEAVLSIEAAQGRVQIGETITAESGGIPLKIVGFTEGMLIGVGPTLWTPLETYEQLFKAANPDAKVMWFSAVAVQPEAGVAPEQLAADLSTALPELDAMTAEEAVRTVPGRDAIQGAFSLMMTLCYLVVGVVIGFFFLTITLHKESSITLMRAIGVHGSYLVRCLLLQVSLVTGVGVVLGVLLMLLMRPAVQNVVTVGFDLASLLSVAIPALLVSLLGAVASIRRILRVDPNAIVSRPLLGSVS